MAELGMQLPGSGGPRKPQMNVYTGLMALAVICLGAACFFVWQAGSKVAPNDSPTSALYELQDENNIQIRD